MDTNGQEEKVEGKNDEWMPMIDSPAFELARPNSSFL
jgi:hypothetical protein